MDSTCAILFLFGSAVFFLAEGISISSGMLKTWFVSELNLPVSQWFGSVLMGLSMLVLGLSLQGRQFNWLSEDLGLHVIEYVVFPLAGLGVVFAIIPIPWLYPAWYRWLRSNHDDIMPTLKREAKEMGGWKWQERVRTWESLERWVDEVRRKHNLFRPGEEPPPLPSPSERLWRGKDE